MSKPDDGRRLPALDAWKLVDECVVLFDLRVQVLGAVAAGVLVVQDLNLGALGFKRCKSIPALNASTTKCNNVRGS